MKTKFFTLLFAIMADTTLSYAAIVNGTCGDNLTWSLNTQDSTLTIEGSGAMTSFYSSSSIPWFDYRQYIAYAYLPEGLTNIGRRAFYYCSKLKSVIIPENVTSIEQDAFRYCNALISINIPNSVKTIGANAFEDCKSMTHVTIGNGLISVGDVAFQGCRNLTGVYISDLAAWCGVAFLNGGGTNPLYLAHNLYLNGDLVTDLVIPNNVTEISQMAFFGCKSLVSVTIHNNVNSIGRAAFYQCSNLKTVIIGNTVANIEGSLFYDCSSLTSITLGKNISSVNNLAFYNCLNLTSITCKASVPPSLIGDVFLNVDKSKVSLFVPSQSIETYSNTLGWEDFSKIQAIQIRNYHVTFKDCDGTILSSIEVAEGSAANPPEDPTREGYEFIGWNQDFSNVEEDMIITALYKINQYQVEFRDWNNTLLKEEIVNYNTAATPPANPSRDWYTFVGWDKDFRSVTSDLVVTAQYEEGQTRDNTIFFINGTDDSEISNQVIEIDFPTPPTVAGFTFLKWQVLAGDIDDGIQIQAVYSYDGEPTSAPSIVANPSNPAQKLIRNGNIYILTDDTRTYTLTGQQVR